MWDLRKRTHLKELDLGAEHQMVLDKQGINHCQLVASGMLRTDVSFEYDRA